MPLSISQQNSLQIITRILNKLSDERVKKHLLQWMEDFRQCEITSSAQRLLFDLQKYVKTLQDSLTIKMVEDFIAEVRSSFKESDWPYLTQVDLPPSIKPVQQQKLKSKLPVPGEIQPLNQAESLLVHQIIEFLSKPPSDCQTIAIYLLEECPDGKFALNKTIGTMNAQILTQKNSSIVPNLQKLHDMLKQVLKMDDRVLQQLRVEVAFVAYETDLKILRKTMQQQEIIYNQQNIYQQDNASNRNQSTTSDKNYLPAKSNSPIKSKSPIEIRRLASPKVQRVKSPVVLEKFETEFLQKYPKSEEEKKNQIVSHLQKLIEAQQQPPQQQQTNILQQYQKLVPKPKEAPVVYEKRVPKNSLIKEQLVQQAHEAKKYVNKLELQKQQELLDLQKQEQTWQEIRKDINRRALLRGQQIHESKHHSSEVFNSINQQAIPKQKQLRETQIMAQKKEKVIQKAEAFRAKSSERFNDYTEPMPIKIFNEFQSEFSIKQCIQDFQTEYLVKQKEVKQNEEIKVEHHKFIKPVRTQSISKLESFEQQNEESPQSKEIETESIFRQISESNIIKADKQTLNMNDLRFSVQEIPQVEPQKPIIRQKSNRLIEHTQTSQTDDDIFVKRSESRKYSKFDRDDIGQGSCLRELIFDDNEPPMDLPPEFPPDFPPEDNNTVDDIIEQVTECALKVQEGFSYSKQVTTQVTKKKSKKV
ncbi:Hypothetical_protein [Hexamita inflata]|uniref:Hypothetical_protein n=1 Tax=Hexamita inflata TaxID=28002 RepID=A0AA86TK65_9EUKA|nr:Hypothetical protein HINF_LOCUS3078 [Hexamita inflata]